MNSITASSPGPPGAGSSGARYAFRILLGTTIVWWVLRRYGADPVWAMISVVIVSEPRFESALLAFKSRVVNTLIGSAVGLLFLLLLGWASWSVLVAMAFSVLVCTYAVKIPVNWRIAPVTVAIVMTSGLMQHSRLAGLNVALMRTGEVLLGSGVAVGVAWAVEKIGYRPEAAQGMRA